MYRGTAHFYELFGNDKGESARRAAFVSTFSQSSSGVIIDIGAGTGEIAFLLAEAGHRVLCCEPSPAMYSILMDRLSNRRDLQSRISALPTRVEELGGSARADVAFASSVFSHLSKEDRVSLLGGCPVPGI